MTRKKKHFQRDGQAPSGPGHDFFGHGDEISEALRLRLPGAPVRALDIGTGFGRNAVFLARHLAEGSHVWSVLVLRQNPNSRNVTKSILKWLQARTDGLPEIAFLFEQLAKLKKHYYELCQKLLTELQGGTFFTKAESVFWECLECGHIHEGQNAPQICPVC